MKANKQVKVWQKLVDKDIFPALKKVGFLKP